MHPAAWAPLPLVFPPLPLAQPPVELFLLSRSVNGTVVDLPDGSELSLPGPADTLGLADPTDSGTVAAYLAPAPSSVLAGNALMFAGAWVGRWGERGSETRPMLLLYTVTRNDAPHPFLPFHPSGNLAGALSWYGTVLSLTSSNPVRHRAAPSLPPLSPFSPLSPLRYGIVLLGGDPTAEASSFLPLTALDAFIPAILGTVFLGEPVGAMGVAGASPLSFTLARVAVGVAGACWGPLPSTASCTGVWQSQPRGRLSCMIMVGFALAPGYYEPSPCPPFTAGMVIGAGGVFLVASSEGAAAAAAAAGGHHGPPPARGAQILHDEPDDAVDDGRPHQHPTA